MEISRRINASAILLLAGLLLGSTANLQGQSLPEGRPTATVDLATNEGINLIQGVWRYSDAHLVEVDFRSPGPDLKPSGAPNRTLDIAPHGGGTTIDDAAWEEIAPTTLAARRSSGRVCFNWYRINVTVPERIGGIDPTGSTVVLDVVVDDYAEIWVDGKLARELGQRGGSLVAGWNAPNRLVIGRNVQPGQKIQLAIFGINGPISDPPANFIWIRSARLEFFGRPHALAAITPVATTITQNDPALDAIVSPNAQIEKLAEGFSFIEGPIWHPEGYLLFSDPNRNMIYKWTPQGELSIFRERSGYQGADIADYSQPGSNGLTLDGEGRLTICEHGNRRISRIEKDGRERVLADRYEGFRLNSPNDLVYRSDGTLYFTDPPFGLPKFHDDPRRELPYAGVYALRNGKLSLVANDFTGPNGLAFSPDEKYLYVCNWDIHKKIVMRYNVASDGSLSKGTLFHDFADAPGEEALDGLKVDPRGNLFVSGPGGIRIISSTGKHLGTISGPELPANFAWGDADGGTLYMTARTGLYRIRLRGGITTSSRH